MSLEIVTGYTGKPHITSQQDAILNSTTLASGGKHVISVGNQFEYELKSNTLIRIDDGFAINQGRLMGMANGDYEELDISVGISGSKRCDLIVIHYKKDNESGIETAELRIIEGTAGDDYIEPEYLDNDLLNGNYSEDDLVLYKVKINGLNVEEVEPIYNTWYLDTGWREDLVTIVGVSSVSGPPESILTNIALRVVGKMVSLSGYKYIGVHPNTTATITIPEEFKSRKRKTWSKYIEYHDNTITYSLIDNVITITSSSVTPFFLDLDLMWFID